MDSPAGPSKGAPEQEQEQQEADQPNNAQSQTSLFKPDFFETLQDIHDSLIKRPASTQEKPETKTTQQEEQKNTPPSGITTIVSGRMNRIRELLSDMDSEKPPASSGINSEAIASNLRKATRSAGEAKAATARALGHVRSMHYSYDTVNGATFEVRDDDAPEQFSAAAVSAKLKGAGTKAYVNPLREVDIQPVKPLVCEKTKSALGQFWTNYLKKSQESKNRLLKDLSQQDMLLLLDKNSPEGLVREIATFIHQQSPNETPDFIENGHTIAKIQFYVMTKKFGEAIKLITDLLNDNDPDEHGFLLMRKGDCYTNGKHIRIATWEQAVKKTTQGEDLISSQPHNHPAADTDEVYLKLALAYLEEGYKGPAVNMILLAQRKSEAAADKTYYTALLDHMSGDIPRAIAAATKLAQGGHLRAAKLVLQSHETAYTKASNNFEKLEIRRQALDILHHLVEQTAGRQLHKEFVDKFPL